MGYATNGSQLCSVPFVRQEREKIGQRRLDRTGQTADFFYFFHICLNTACLVLDTVNLMLDVGVGRSRCLSRSERTCKVVKIDGLVTTIATFKHTINK
jgi:hypothetical protein